MIGSMKTPNDAVGIIPAVEGMVYHAPASVIDL